MNPTSNDWDDAPWPDPPAQPRELVEAIFARMVVRFGSIWVSRWAGVDMHAVKADWAKGLATTHRHAIVYGIENMPTDTPPLLGQFKELCSRAPAQRPLEIEDDRPPADPARVARAPQRMADSQAVNAKKNRLQWAYDLQERDRGGERLTEAVRASYLLALAHDTTADAIPMQLNPIPADVLPPAMRNQKETMR